MSTAKRSRRRQTEPGSASPLPASKRIKTTKTSHVPTQPGLGFLVDESARVEKKLTAQLTNGVPDSKTTRVDDSHAVVASDTRDQLGSNEVGETQDTAIDISSSEDGSDEESEFDAGVPQRNHVASKRNLVEQKPLMNGDLSGAEDEDSEADEGVVAGAEDVEMAEQDEDGEIVDDQEPEEPSFADVLQARHPDPIDVQASIQNPMADRQALMPASGRRTLSAPSGTSLGTVLTQALKTNDKNLLESCFQTTHHATIRSTVQRLQSHHVATLLERLAERMHRSPGRTSTLMVWVHWSLVAHGGYLASQPELMKQLKSLSQVVRERASGLPLLLQLKGKLDMLSAQLELRRNLQAESRAANGEDDGDEEGVVYVEGQDEDWSDSEGAEDERTDSKMLEPPLSKPKPQTATPRTNDSQSGDSSDSDDDMPNGVAQEGDDDSSDADGEENEGVFDIEAAENSDSDEDAEDEDSDEEGDSEPESEESEPSDDESDDSGVRPPKGSMLNRKR